VEGPHAEQQENDPGAGRVGEFKIGRIGGDEKKGQDRGQGPEDFAEEIVGPQKGERAAQRIEEERGFQDVGPSLRLEHEQQGVKRAVEPQAQARKTAGQKVVHQRDGLPEELFLETVVPEVVVIIGNLVGVIEKGQGHRHGQEEEDLLCDVGFLVKLPEQIKEGLALRGQAPLQENPLLVAGFLLSGHGYLKNKVNAMGLATVSKEKRRGGGRQC